MGFSILVFGYRTCTGDDAWSEWGLLVYSLPLLAQLLPYPAVRVWSVWLGIALVVQTVLSPLFPILYFTRKPNTITRNYYHSPDFKPGITGTHVVTTDSMGFRAKPPVDYSRKKGFRIFAIGGSTTEDAALDDDLTWTHLLQERLKSTTGKPVEVINTGMAGLRAIHNLHTLQVIESFEPDLVIFLLGANEIVLHMYLADLGVREGERYVDPEHYKPQNTLLGRTLTRLATMTGSARTAQPVVTEHHWDRNSYHPGHDSLRRPEVRPLRPERVNRESAATLEKIASICDRASYRCLFLTNPSAWQENVTEELKRKFWMTPLNKPYTHDLASLVHLSRLYNAFIVDLARAHRQPLCDVAPLFAPTTENFYDDNHLNVSGAKRMADVVHDCIVSQTLMKSGGTP